MRLFVYIVESPSPMDFYHNIHEGSLISQAASLNSLPSKVMVAISRSTFLEALSSGFQSVFNRNPESSFVLHISAHGFPDGIALSNGEIVLWEDLRNFLFPINSLLNGNLLLCLSTCNGFSGSEMAMHPEDKQFPFFGLIANSREPKWPQTGIAFATFYHLLSQGLTISEAVSGMRVASNNNDFYCIFSEIAREWYLKRATEHLQNT